MVKGNERKKATLKRNDLAAICYTEFKVRVGAVSIALTRGRRKW